MRKTNLFKSIVCGLMLTAVVGTTGFAATRALTPVDDGDNVLDVDFYNDTYTGIYGTFSAYGEPTKALTSVTNPGGPERTYFIWVRSYNSLSDVYIETDYSTVRLSSGMSQSVEVFRGCHNQGYRYEHLGRSYSANTVNSVIIDDYNCKLYQ